MSEISSHRITLEGHALYYRIAGDWEKQHVVFFNGWGARLDGWWGSDKVISELAKYFYIVSPELPGFMRSDPPKRVWKVEDYAHIAYKILTPLGLRNPVIMGQSFGGGVAALYTKYYGKGVRCLVLIDAVLSGRKENWFFRLRFRMTHLAKFVNASPLPSAFKKVLWCLYSGVPYAMLKRSDLNDYLVMPQFMASPYYIPGVDYKELNIPLLLVWGNRDTWVSDMERAKAIHAEVPTSKLIIVKGSHTVLYKRPVYVVNEIIKALREMAIL